MANKKDTENLGFIAASSRHMSDVLERMEVNQGTTNDLLEAILSATNSKGKGGGGGIGGFMESIGKAGKGMKEGGEGMKEFAEGVLDLSKALLRFVVVPKKSAFTGFFKDLSEAFGKAGEEENSKNIKRGMAVTKDMGMALLIFGGSLALSTVLFIVGAPGAVLATLAIAGLSYVFATVGKAADQISEGAKAVAWMGLSIAALALGVYFFQSVLGDDPAAMLLTAGVLALTVGALALVFGIAGKFASEIAMGSAALILGGIALIAISAGLLIFKKADVGFQDVGIMAATIVTLGVVFALAGIPVVAGFIALGAGVLILAGVSLMVISGGLAVFKTLKWDETDGDSLVNAMSSLGEGFSSISLEGIFKMTAAVPGLIGAGLGLMSISAGLKAFKKVEFGADDAETLKTVITGLADAFSVAGGAPASPGSSLVGLLIGGPNVVEKGISSVMGAGRALTGITEGLKSFASLEKMGLGKEAFDVTKEGSIMSNIMKTVTVLDVIFSRIGKGDSADERSVFGKLFFDDATDVQRGIDSVKGVGDVLNEIADGLKKWQTMPIDMTAVTTNIKNIVGAIGTAFGSIGGAENEDQDSALFGLISWDENKIAKGIDAVKGVGKELEGIANGLKIFQDLGKVGLSDADFELVYTDGPDGKKVYTSKGLITNIAKLITGVSEIFSVIGADEGFFSESDVENGIESVEGLGPVLEGLAKSIKKFADLGADGGGTKIATALDSIFASIIKAPSEDQLGNLKATGDELERIAKFEDPFENLAKSFSKIVDSTEKFSTAFKKMDKNAIVSYTAFTRALVDFSKIQTGNLVSSSSVASDFISKSTNKISVPQTYTPPPAPKAPTPAGEKSVATAGSSPVSASKPKAAAPDNSSTVLNQGLSELANEVKNMSSKLGRIETALSGTIKVHNVE
jgi:hypothetical protein